MATGEAFTQNGSYALSERSSRILGALIRQYIDRGEPVSSLWLAQHGGVGLSSATVRSIMVELEQGGYIYQPHTSAGRVPTDQGYRYFVDRLLRTRKNSLSSPVVEARLRQAVSVRDVISNVSHELSVASHHLAFACMPSTETDTFKHIGFVPVNDATVLVVVRTKNGNVSQKPVRLNETVDRVSLTQGANYLNEEFFGLSLWDVRAAIVEQLRQEEMLYDQLRSRALRLASVTLEDMEPANQLFIEGAGFLAEEVSDGEDRVPLGILQTLLAMIERKDLLVKLLNEYIDGPGMTVVIGTENSTPEMQAFSLVTSTYFDGEHRGSIGIIGPRRMRYSRAISTVDRVSTAVSRVLVAQTTPPRNDRQRKTERVRRHRSGGSCK